MKYLLVFWTLLAAPLFAQQDRPTRLFPNDPVNPCSVITPNVNNWIAGRMWQCVGASGVNRGTWRLISQAIAPSSAWLISKDYDFTPQTGAAPLSAGVNTVNMNPCPSGVNGTDPGHYLWISGGIGVGEPVRITGGTCTANGVGTLIFTTAGVHAGAWTISSATCGIEEAIFSLPANGGRIFEPAETCVLRGPIVKPPITVYIEGAGVGATIWRIPAVANGDEANFPLGVLGVYQIPDDLTFYNTTVRLSGGFSDLAISFYQPLSATSVAALTHWPPAIYAHNTARPYFHDIMWSLAWDGLKIDGIGDGFYLVDTKSSAFHRSIDVDGQVDSSRIRGFQNWPFGAPTGSPLLNVMLYDPNVYAFWIGTADDLKIEGCATDGANSGDIHFGASGNPPWVTFEDCDLDTGRLNITAGKVFLNNSVINAYVNPGFNGVTTSNGITMSTIPGQGSPELFATNSTIGLTAPITGYAVNIDYSAAPTIDEQGLGGAVFSNCRFYTTQDTDLIYVHSSTARTGLLTLIGNHVVLPLAASVDWNSFPVHAVGPVKVIATGNDVTSKVDHPGTWFKADTDYGHVITGNSATAWSIGYPPTLRVSTFANNQGITNPTPISASVAVIGGNEIDPSGPLFHVTGNTTFSTILQFNQRFPYGNTFNVGLYQFTMIPDAVFSWTTGANIALAGTSVIGKAITFTYDPATTKWYPSAVN